MEIDHILDKAEASPRALTRAELAALLSAEDADALFARALAVRMRASGRGVSIRGLIEAGNVCAKDCLYCGIRKGNAKVRRYEMGADEIVADAVAAFKAGYGSVVVQSGEIASPARTAFVEDVLKRIRDAAGDGFGITLSLGEQDEETYMRWRAAGAHRYLLRIETSDPALYAKIHPADHSWERRVEALRALARCGYQVGTGVMCGLPGQTFDSLAADIEFFAQIDADMIGMGPFIPHPDTPLGASAPWNAQIAAERLDLGLRMIAATRLYLHDVNIAAATALQALAPDGRERGLLAGANVVMPNVTPARYRADYKLYVGKPCTGENAADCRACIQRRIESAGGTVLWNERGDSPHWRKKCSHS